MASKFEEKIKKAKKEGEAKLKVIAPKFTPPPSKTIKAIEKIERKRRSSRRRSSSSSAQKAAAQKAAAQKAAAKAATKAAADAKAAKVLIEKTRAAARARIAAQQKQLRARLTKQENLSLIAREDMRIAALARGRGFTKREGEQFIKSRGGSMQSLMNATRKGFDITAPSDVRRIEIGALERKDITIPKNILQQLDRERKSKVIQTTQQINSSLQNFRKTGEINSKILNIADIATGGAFTERSIDKDQGALNSRIEKFNNKFGLKELTETEFNKAQAEQKFISSEQSRIDKRRDDLATSKRDSVRDFLQKFKLQGSPRLTTQEKNKIIEDRENNKQIQSKIKINKPLISNKQTSINSKSKEIKKLQDVKARTIAQDVKLLRLRNQVNTLESDIARLEFRAPPKIIATEFPIIPSTRIPNTISKISFLGTQKAAKDGKVVTDIVFRTKEGIMGVAKGVSVEKKGEVVSVVAGRHGKVSVKLLSGKRRIRGIQSFVGREKAKAKSAEFTTDELGKIARFQDTQKHKDDLRIVRSNIKGIEQAGLGRIATVKGKKFIKPVIRFPSGKLSTKVSKGIDLDDFASISAILTKKDLSTIIGKTITAKGRKAEFIGLIKNLKGSDKIVALSSSEKQQFSKATQKLLSSVAASVAKAEKTKGVTTRPLKIAAAAALLSKTPTALAKPTTIGKRAILKKPTPTQIKTINKLKTQQKSIKKKIIKQTGRVKQLSKQKPKQTTKQKGKQTAKQKAIQKTKQIARQKTTQRTIQAQKTLQRLVARQKVIQKQISRAGGTVPRIPRVPRVPLIPKRKSITGKTTKTLSSPVQVFDVFGKSKGKFVKLNTKPLTREDALSKGAFAIDRTTAATFKISTKGKSKTPGSLLKSEKNYFKRQGFKLREIKIKRGRKFILKNEYIEKTKHRIDTKSEKGGLTVAKLLRQQRKKASMVKSRGRKVSSRKRSVVRSANTASKIREQRLKNLKKARAVRKKMKGGKRK